MEKDYKEKFLILTREELAYLSNQFKNTVLVGLPLEKLTSPDNKDQKIQKTLLEKGFVKDAEGIIVSPTQPGTLRTLFNPDRALIVARNQKNLGVQRNIFCARKDHFILHVQPDEVTHMIREIPADSIFPAVLDWLKFDYVRFRSGLSFSMPENELEAFRIKVEKEGTSAVSDEKSSIYESKKQLADAIQTREFSASIASVNINKDEAENVITFSLLVGQKSAWIFTTQPNQPGYLHIETIGSEFPSFMQGIIRSVVEESQSAVQSFVLSEETLAYCLAAINRADLGLKLLAGKYGQLTEEKLSAVLTKARNVLIKAELCTLTDGDHSRLDEQLERAIFPMVMCDFVVRAQIISPDLQRHANIYTQIGKHFTSTIRTADKIYLEHDKTSALGKYLFSVYADFGKDSQPVVKGNEKIRLSILQDLTSSGNDKNKVNEILKKEVLPERVKSTLETDVQNQVYRGLIQIIDAGSTGVDQSTLQLARKTLLLMQSTERSWVFEFADTRKDPIGSIRTVSRDEFREILNDFLF